MSAVQKLSKNANGVLAFTEDAWDVDGDNIVLQYVKVTSIDGAPPADPTPGWLIYTTRQELDGGTRKFYLDFTIPPDDLSPGSEYQIEAAVRDEFSDNVVRSFCLKIKKTGELGEAVVFDDSGNYTVYDVRTGDIVVPTASTPGPDMPDVSSNLLLQKENNKAYSVRSGDLVTVDLSDFSWTQTSAPSDYLYGVYRHSDGRLFAVNGNDQLLEFSDESLNGRTVVANLPPDMRAGFSFDEEDNLAFTYRRDVFDFAGFYKTDVTSGTVSVLYSAPEEDRMSFGVDTINKRVYSIEDDTNGSTVRVHDYSGNVLNSWIEPSRHATRPIYVAPVADDGDPLLIMELETADSGGDDRVRAYKPDGTLVWTIDVANNDEWVGMTLFNL